MPQITMTQTFNISDATAKALLAASKAGKPSTLTFTFNPTLAQIAQVASVAQRNGSTAAVNSIVGPITSDVRVEHG